MSPRSGFPLALALLALLPAGCALPEGARQAPSPRHRPGAPAPPLASDPATRQCLADLRAAGATFTPLPDQTLAPGCTNLGTVRLQAVRGDEGEIGIANIGPVTCPVAATLAAWARFGADRAARQIFDSRLASIQTFGSFSCRNVAGTARLSAHARAAAVDVAGFTLADGRRITVVDGWTGEQRERAFLRLVHTSACRRFDTVLGPAYNAAHRDHFHLEGVIAEASFCR